MNDPVIYVDFNELIEPDLVLLSKEDSKTDINGQQVIFYEGMTLLVYMDDHDENGNVDNLVAAGTAELNTDEGWSSHVKWCCRINEDGICSESELEKE